ncbi:hypothetical protein [Chroococcidiopsis sp. SAG 2025]|uniref:hypothetical protein n=1 Tax=Chroococcidiopsis sp. SAG 2025 TaxID=171389 RepID=UPI002937242B|nr:hypothetical protein [Chroococcidiopsis sp. SAG 2025]
MLFNSILILIFSCQLSVVGAGLASRFTVRRSIYAQNLPVPKSVVGAGYELRIVPLVFFPRKKSHQQLSFTIA